MEKKYEKSSAEQKEMYEYEASCMGLPNGCGWFKHFKDAAPSAEELSEETKKKYYSLHDEESPGCLGGGTDFVFEKIEKKKEK